MKRILSLILMLSLLAGIVTFSASAKTVWDVVSGVTSEQQIFDDMYQLCEAVDGGDVANVFQTVNIVYPDLVATIKKNMNDDYVPSAYSSAGFSDERYVYAVTQLLQNDVFLDDLEKLTDAVSTGDGGTIYLCILEIYPDFVTTLKRALETYSDGDAVALCPGGEMTAEEKPNDYSVLWVICAGVGGIAVGAVPVYFIMKKKKTC